MIAQDIMDAVKVDREKHLKYGVSLNPFSTESARRSWQRGFDGTPCDLLDYIGAYQRGVAAKLLAKG